MYEEMKQICIINLWGNPIKNLIDSKVFLRMPSYILYLHHYFGLPQCNVATLTAEYKFTTKKLSQIIS